MYRRGSSARPPGPFAFLPALAFALLPLTLPLTADVVLNEVHYDPPNPAQPAEFVELHNTSPTPANIGGWHLDGGIRFDFPNPTQIPAGGFVVVARDPTAFAAVFGFRPLGPWEGRLSNDGERLALTSDSGTVIDELRYGAGFPWPTAARGAGASMELIHPALDHAQPGAWRSSAPAKRLPPVTFIPSTSPAWHFRKGTNEASQPASAWRAVAFVEDSTWRIGQASIGYGDEDDNTPLADMRGGYSSLFLRHPFVVPPGGIPEALVLRIRVDDGCIAWLNGTEVARLHVPEGNLAFNATAQDHEATAAFEEISIPSPQTRLREGTNVLCIQVFNATLESSDLTMDAELRTPGVTTPHSDPTPGRTNSTVTATLVPMIAEVRHTPSQPRAGEPVRVLLRLAKPDPAVQARLHLQQVEPGRYIRRSDPAYNTQWTETSLHDDGLDGDDTAGDGTYTARIPGDSQVHRRLTRYRITVRDGRQEDAAVTVPYADDESPNFAWFTYDGAPAWRGANRPGGAGTNGAVTEFPAATLRSLPIYHLLAQSTDVTRSQYDGSADGVRMWGTLVYDGEVYDHVSFHNRGEASTYVSGKNKWRFHFNRARRFLARDAWGRPYRTGWDVLNLNGCSSPWAAVHRGMAGLDESLSFRIYELLGVPASKTHHVHFRVVDGAVEASPTSQYDGDLWGLYLAVEHPDGRFLDERGLPDGNLYKLEGGADKKHQAEGQALDNSDWNTFSSRSGSTQTEAWWRSNLDVDTYFHFHIANRITGNIDLREDWNHYFYHHPSGRWMPIPWDLDMQFIPKSHWSGTIDQKACLNVAALRRDFRNRGRDVLDLLLSDASPSGGQIGQLIEELAAHIEPVGTTNGWTRLDQYLWNWNPRTTGDGTSVGETEHKGNFYRTPFQDSRIGGSWTRTLVASHFRGSVRYLLDYTTDTFTGAAWAANNGQQRGYAYQYVRTESRDPDIPDRPAITATGPSTFPVDQLWFMASPFGDPQGADTFAGIRWRLAEITAPGLPAYREGTPMTYEIEPLWVSDWLPASGASIRIPFDHLAPGHTYRVRCQHLDASGRTSRWSEPIQFNAGEPDPATLTALRERLRITELMYHPAAATPEETAAGFSTEDFEFIELRNLGTSPLDLSAVRMEGGIAFPFPAGFALGPGVSTVVVQNPRAFEHRYGPGWFVVGTYAPAHLGNRGDTLRIVRGVGTVLSEFNYGDRHPWPEAADGHGPSLALQELTPGTDPADPSHWSASTAPGGTPGRSRNLTYLEWTGGKATLLDPAGDPDHDGRSNWTEFSEGTPPLVADPSPSLSISQVSDTFLDIVSLRNLAATGTAPLLESSPDLRSWFPGGTIIAHAYTHDDIGQDFWRIPLESPLPLHRFVRVRWRR